MSEVDEDRCLVAVSSFEESGVVDGSGLAEVELGEGRVELEGFDAGGVVLLAPLADVPAPERASVEATVEAVLTSVREDVLLLQAVDCALLPLVRVVSPACHCWQDCVRDFFVAGWAGRFQVNLSTVIVLSEGRRLDNDVCP